MAACSVWASFLSLPWIIYCLTVMGRLFQPFRFEVMITFAQCQQQQQKQPRNNNSRNARTQAIQMPNKLSQVYLCGVKSVNAHQHHQKTDLHAIADEFNTWSR